MIETAYKVFGDNLPVNELQQTFDIFNISTNQQQAAFLAQVGHESGNFKHSVENLNYSAKGLANTWPSRFKDKQTQQPNELALQIQRQPQLIANRVYNGRLGNAENSNDGWMYRGRGYIQITGRDNYVKIAKHMEKFGLLDSQSIIDNPAILQQPLYACLSAGAYWDLHNLNDYVNDFKTLTKKINGGLIGYQHRVELYQKLMDI